ncbi:dUTP diphosphatase [Alkalihalobacterium alkalinitrilicum]|uniref:dUTP diphosphatase n=1 Tax=Alkalihalobacterium alkalinitrilicum TaxID=427920 RepID=UPI0009957113|nr:dUTP diphosphatase [Alkalihalobacterium alkalinitrilicum]
MNISKLFELQRVLDDRIVKEKGLEGVNLIPIKKLALQVEIGELANEQRTWKFWSNDRKPRTRVAKFPTMNYDDIKWHNPVLEEYVDCFHFVLSIGNDIISNIKGYTLDLNPRKSKDIVQQFNSLFHSVYWMDGELEDYEMLLDEFLGLGEMLGFTWEQIEQAYLNKNKVNHERQENGY